MNDRLGLRCSYVRACGLSLRTVNSDNTHCAFVPSSLSHYFILIALTLLTREPLQRGIKLRTMWRCLHCRCFTVTLTASRIPIRHDAARIVAVTAPACRHPSRQPTAPPENDHRGLLTPKPPAIPQCSPPFRPQEGLRSRHSMEIDSPELEV